MSQALMDEYKMRGGRQGRKVRSIGIYEMNKRICGKTFPKRGV
jgi:hypothetical protein